MVWSRGCAVDVVQKRLGFPAASYPARCVRTAVGHSPSWSVRPVGLFARLVCSPREPVARSFALRMLRRIVARLAMPTQSVPWWSRQVAANIFNTESGTILATRRLSAKTVRFELLPEEQTGMSVSSADSQVTSAKPKSTHTARWIAMGLGLGVLVGLLFGDACGSLQVFGNAYVGLLQMTVLPYLLISLISKLGRLGAKEARAIGYTALVVLLVLWLIAIILIVLTSAILPPIEGASFYSPDQNYGAETEPDVLSRFIPTNVFRSLTHEYVPAVVVFCLFFGCALMMVPGKEPLLDFLDLCSDGIGRINVFLVRLSPLGLFALTAAAAGTIRIEELSRLQAYLIMLTLASVGGCLRSATTVAKQPDGDSLPRPAPRRPRAAVDGRRYGKTFCGPAADHRQVRSTTQRLPRGSVDAWCESGIRPE